MGVADTVTKEYMRNNAVFADAFNYLIYGGRQVLVPEQLHELDTTETVMPFGADGVHNNGPRDAVQKYRDILKSAVIMRNDKAAYVILGIENQTEVHYAMPVRNIVYDALQYERQVADIATAHRKNGSSSEKHSKGEYLSGFYRDDYIKPVITLVVHFGADRWDAPLSLYDMMRLDDPEMMGFVQDYRIHLIEPAAMSDADLLKFSTSLREVMGCIKYSGNDKELRAFIDDNPRMMMDVNAARVIGAVTKIKFEDDADSGEVNMCKAIEDMIAEGKAEGKAEGRISAFADMIRSGIINLDKAAELSGMSVDEFQSALDRLQLN